VYSISPSLASQPAVSCFLAVLSVSEILGFRLRLAPGGAGNCQCAGFGLSSGCAAVARNQVGSQCGSRADCQRQWCMRQASRPACRVWQVSLVHLSGSESPLCHVLTALARAGIIANSCADVTCVDPCRVGATFFGVTERNGNRPGKTSSVPSRQAMTQERCATSTTTPFQARSEQGKGQEVFGPAPPRRRSRCGTALHEHLVGLLTIVLA
jgi:hypothetical protein